MVALVSTIFGRFAICLGRFGGHSGCNFSRILPCFGETLKRHCGVVSVVRVNQESVTHLVLYLSTHTLTHTHTFILLLHAIAVRLSTFQIGLASKSMVVILMRMRTQKRTTCTTMVFGTIMDALFDVHILLCFLSEWDAPDFCSQLVDLSSYVCRGIFLTHICALSVCDCGSSWVQNGKSWFVSHGRALGGLVLASTRPVPTTGNETPMDVVFAGHGCLDGVYPDDRVRAGCFWVSLLVHKRALPGCIFSYWA